MYMQSGSLTFLISKNGLMRYIGGGFNTATLAIIPKHSLCDQLHVVRKLKSADVYVIRSCYFRVGTVGLGFILSEVYEVRVRNVYE